MKGASHRTPDWLLERIALGELSPEKLAAARAQLAEEPEGLERLKALEESTHAALAAYPPEQVTAEIQRRSHLARVHRHQHQAPARRIRRALVWGVPAAAALTLVMILSPRALTPKVTPHIESPEDLRTKGLVPQVFIHRQTPSGSEQLQEGGRAVRNDVLQLSYFAGSASFGAILSIDGRGAVTLHWPLNERDSLELKHGGSMALPRAYKLDDAPRFERFFFVTSNTPFDLKAVLSAARALAASPERARTQPLPLPSTLEQSTFTLEKATP